MGPSTASGFAVSLVVAVASTAGYVYYGSVDFVLGTALELAAVVGVVAGARIAHAARVKPLQRVTAVAIMGIGLLLGAQTVW